MKRLACILLCLLCCISLVSCAPGGYLTSKEGDITVSLPEKVNPSLPEFTEEQKLILGKWELVSITDDDNERTYKNSSYTFSETGTCKVILNGVKTTGKFEFVDGILNIDSKAVDYKIENDTLTITDEASKIHLLTKAAE